MQTEKAIDAEEKTVDIDTSGPDTEVELNPAEEKTTESTATSTTEEISVETVATDAQNQTSETNEEPAKADEKEASKKKELEEYSDGVKRRIAKLTKKMREAERREAAATELAKIEIEKRKSMEIKQQGYQKDVVEQKSERLKASMAAAIAKLSKAREEGNLKDEVEAQTEIGRLGYEEQALKSAPLIEPERVINEPKVEENREVRQQEAPVNPDPKAQAWASKNDWFGKDEAMTYTAFALHKKLTEEEGYDPQSDEYYSEIDKRIKLEFPQKFDKVESQTTEKPTQTVASAARTSKTGRKVVRLTPSQVAIAKKLGVPLEEYAKQLNTKE